MAEENNNNIQDEKELEKQRHNYNNAKNVRNAADVAMASGHPVGVVVGGAVKAADKATGGKASETLGKGLTVANKITPGGNRFQRMSNQLSESGASDAIGKAASIKNSADNKSMTEREAEIRRQNVEKTANQVKQKGEQQSSPSSSNTEKKVPERNHMEKNDSLPKNDSIDSKEDNEEKDDKKKNTSLLGSMLKGGIVAVIIPFLLIGISFILVVVMIISSIFGIFGEFDDAFGISNTIGEEIGGLDYSTDEEHQKFFDRVNEVKEKYQKNGLVVDPLKVVATFHIIMNNGANIDYSKISSNDIELVAQALFDANGISSDEVFRNHLIESILPKYLPKKSIEERSFLVDDIFQYIEDYYDLIGKDTGNLLCNTGVGVCSYQVNGFYVKDKGNISEKLSLSNVYVRIMECNSNTKALTGEELVPLEKYLLGVTYYSLDEKTSAEAVKAQIVAERNTLLGQHAALNKNLKKEANKNIIQVSSCDKNFTYCDPDKGCSTSSDGIVHSGLSYSSNVKQPLEENSLLRRSVRSVEGELLANADGFVVYTNYSSTDKSSLLSLANRGLSYKQILMQYYNQGSHNIGASELQSNSCSSVKTSDCISTGEFSKWKQKNPAWSNIPMGDSGKTVGQIGCLVTAVAMQIAKSGVPTTVSPFNPGTFVKFLNINGGFSSGGNFIWASATKVAPKFHYEGMISVSGMTKEQKLAKIRELAGIRGVYVLAEVMGSTGQHWVAIDSVNGDTINIMDSGNQSGNTNMWSQYNWVNTSTLAYYRVS